MGEGGESKGACIMYADCHYENIMDFMHMHIMGNV